MCARVSLEKESMSEGVGDSERDKWSESLKVCEHRWVLALLRYLGCRVADLIPVMVPFIPLVTEKSRRGNRLKVQAHLNSYISGHCPNTSKFTTSLPPPPLHFSFVPTKE